MPRASALLLALCLLAAGCGGSGSSHRSAPPPARGPFAFDPSQPFAFVDRGRVNRKYPIRVDDVSYASGQDSVSGYLVRPPKTHKRLPAVVFLHGAGGDRSELLVPATWIAARGAIALTITAPSSVAQPSHGGSATYQLRRDVKLTESDVVAVRRAIELLRRRPDVDPARVGFVGWSAGARTGAILSGVQRDLPAIVLMSAGAVPVGIYAHASPKSLRPTITKELTLVDPLRYVERARGRDLMLQDGRNDQVVPHSALLELLKAAPPGTTVRWYDANHPLNAAAYRDQLAFLAHRLGVSGPVVNGAETGPS
ncbi:MAG TPA: acyl-CoA thioester hydrolase/BAAT C-terminal domain-containing protein [Gaiellaceae bacterium]|nr:acyl-CoA thioester hydrolase/BAAT C-terminal domain-containing protein [Gaiellaceae bacterium]